MNFQAVPRTRAFTSSPVSASARTTQLCKAVEPEHLPVCVRGWRSRLDKWARLICVGRFRGLPVQIVYGNGQGLPNPITTHIASIPTLLPQAHITHNTLASPAKHGHTFKFFFTSQTAPKCPMHLHQTHPRPRRTHPRRLQRTRSPRQLPRTPPTTLSSRR